MDFSLAKMKKLLKTARMMMIFEGEEEKQSRDHKKIKQ